MSIITTVPEDEATGTIAQHYADDIRDQGFVSAHTKVLSLNPEAMAAWETLITAIGRPMGKRRYELVTLAAALGARSQHCRLAHGGRTLDLELFDEPTLIAIATDYLTATLTEAEVAMMEFAERVSRDASTMTDDDSRRLREVGFSDREIVDIALAAAARNYYSRACQALAVAVEVPANVGPALRDALVAGT